MLDETTRTAILKLHEQGHGTRTIARVLGVSRNAVKKVLALGTSEVPPVDRPELAELHRGDTELSGAHGLLPQARHWPRAEAAGGTLRLCTGSGDAARHLAARGRGRGQAAPLPHGVLGALLFANDLLSVLS